MFYFKHPHKEQTKSRKSQVGFFIQKGENKWLRDKSLAETSLNRVPRREEGTWRWKGEERKVVGTGQGQSHKHGHSSDWKQVKGSRYAEIGAWRGGRAVSAPKKGEGWTHWPSLSADSGTSSCSLQGLASPSPARSCHDHPISHQHVSFKEAEKILENHSCSNSAAEERKSWHSHLFHEKGAAQASIRWMLSPFSLNEDKW